MSAVTHRVVGYMLLLECTAAEHRSLNAQIIHLDARSHVDSQRPSRPVPFPTSEDSLC